MVVTRNVYTYKYSSRHFNIKCTLMRQRTCANQKIPLPMLPTLPILVYTSILCYFAINIRRRQDSPYTILKQNIFVQNLFELSKIESPQQPLAMYDETIDTMAKKALTQYSLEPNALQTTNKTKMNYIRRKEHLTGVVLIPRTHTQSTPTTFKQSNQPSIGAQGDGPGEGKGPLTKPVASTLGLGLKYCGGNIGGVTSPPANIESYI
eukprot:TRINITY_DN13869_c0_g1_i2.p3 TRINITY_DN13869_c0_g1~~TRINITY_DN13869_c0_g1_i2.p3  ORF type:complete len:207 (-),score=-4.16 TRINITY_DN13869_c0_g1_i2:123-743(-)